MPLSAEAKRDRRNGNSGGPDSRMHSHHARQPPLEWCIEARSRSWQLMSRSWNSVVTELRYEDYLSDQEKDDLVFLQEVSGAFVADFAEIFR